MNWRSAMRPGRQSVALIAAEAIAVVILGFAVESWIADSRSRADKPTP
jgi:hypothetical protein